MTPWNNSKQNMWPYSATASKSIKGAKNSSTCKKHRKCHKKILRLRHHKGVFIFLVSWKIKTDLVLLSSVESYKNSTAGYLKR